MKIVRVLLFVAVLIGFAAPVHAGFDDGVTAYNKGDYATAYEEFKPLAEQGDAKSQYNLGVMYSNGQGVSKDYAEAVKWCRKAADQGYADGQYNLGVMYYLGKGVPKDYVQAYMWFDLAAEQGISDAKKAKDKLAGSMTSAHLAQARRLAKQWKPKGGD
jgi:TPR repeat protein